MAANRITVWVALIAGMYLAAPVAHAQQPKLERGMKVVARSPDFVLRDGDKVVARGSPFDIYRVERVDGDRVRLHSDGREGDARASEVVRIDQAEAYFSEQIKANPRAVYGYVMRCFVRGRFLHDQVNARLDCEQAFRLEPKNSWVCLLRAECADQDGDVKSAFTHCVQAILLDNNNVCAYIARAGCHFGEKDYDRALADLADAISRDANNIEARVLRGVIWLEKGDREKALRNLMKPFGWIAKACTRGWREPDITSASRTTARPWPM